MTPEQKAAFIAARTALFNAKIALMQAANTTREQRGESLAYGEEQFAKKIADWEAVIGYHAVLDLYFRQ